MKGLSTSFDVLATCIQILRTERIRRVSSIGPYFIRDLVINLGITP